MIDGNDYGINTSTWERAKVKISDYLKEVGSYFHTCIQGLIPVSTEAADYEKGAMIIEIETDDPSEIANHDCVGQSVRAGIRTGNMKGRAWCQEIVPIIRAGADGTVLGIELGMANWGSDQPEFDTATTKGLRSCVPGEFGSTGHATFIEYVTAGAGRPRFINGYMARQGAFLDMQNARVWSIREYGGNQESYSVQANGVVNVSGLTIGGRKVIIGTSGELRLE